MFERLSLDPIYNTRAVVQRTGVPADTFRAWERRYQVPAPSRDAQNRRLYSEQDISVIGWLRDQTRTGVTISQAVAIFHSSQFEGRARTVSAEPGSPQGALIPATASPFAQLRRELVQALHRLDGALARHIVQESLSICNVESVCVDLLYGGYLDLTAENGTVDVSCPCDHFACSFIQRTLSALFNQSNPDQGRGPIVAAAPEGERREIELLVTALLLSRHGYKVIYLGTGVPLHELRHSLACVRPAVLLLFASDPQSVGQLESLSFTLRDAGVDRTELAVGGKLFAARPELRERAGRTILPDDPRGAVRAVDTLLMQRPGA